VSCKSKEQVQGAIDQLKEIYHDIMVHDRDTLDHLGLIMTYNREAGSVKINMEKNIEGTILILLRRTRENSKDCHDTSNQ
jgi:hypothetical protein